MRRRRAFFMGVVAILAVLLAGCVPTSSPSPSPSLPSPAPSENAQEREERIAYEEAEAAYRAFGTEYDRVAAAGGALTATAIMNRTAGGPFLRAYTQVLRQQKEAGAIARGGAVIAFVKPAGFSRTSLLLSACEDGSGIRIFDAAGKQIGSGEVARLRLTARKISERWLIWQSEEDKVTTC